MVTQFANVFQHWISKKKCSKVHLFQWYAWYISFVYFVAMYKSIDRPIIEIDSSIFEILMTNIFECSSNAFQSKMHFLSFFFLFSFVSFMVKNENKHLYHTYTFCFKIKTIKIALFFYYLFWIIFYPFVVSLFHITFSFLAKFSLLLIFFSLGKRKCEITTLTNFFFSQSHFVCLCVCMCVYNIHCILKLEYNFTQI